MLTKSILHIRRNDNAKSLAHIETDRGPSRNSIRTTQTLRRLHKLNISRNQIFYCHAKIESTLLRLVRYLFRLPHRARNFIRDATLYYALEIASQRYITRFANNYRSRSTDNRASNDGR